MSESTGAPLSPGARAVADPPAPEGAKERGGRGTGPSTQGTGPVGTSSAGASDAEAKKHRPAGRWAEGVARWAPRILVVAACWQLLILIFRPLGREVARWAEVPLALLSLPHPTVFSVVLTLIIAGAMGRRLRVSLWFVWIVWQIPSIVVVAIYGLADILGDTEDTFLQDAGLANLTNRTLFYIGGLIALILLVVLVTARRAYTARVRRGAWWQALLTLFIGLAIAFAATFGLSQVAHGTLEGERDRVSWSLSVITGTSPHEPPLASLGDGPHWLLLVGSVISTIALLLALYVFLRAKPRTVAEHTDHELHVRRLLLKYPSVDDSLAYFATREDREEIYSSNGEAAVSFRVQGNVALAAGDPIGDPAHWEDAARRWLMACRTYGWVPSIWAPTERGAVLYERLGMHVLPLGDESVLDTRTFSINAPELAAVRHAIARPRREGYTVRIARQSDIDPQDLADIVAKAEEWRDGEERGYSMSLSRFGDPRDPRAMIVSAYDGEGTLRGVLGFVPWGRTGISLDVMRRSPEAANGVTELMISTLATQGGGLGVERISLNFAMLRSVFEVGERVGATTRQRFLRRVLMVGSRFWQLDSLYRSNQKYNPTWVTRYMGSATQPQLLGALIRYGQVEGFIKLAPWEERRYRALMATQHTPDQISAVLAQEEDLRMPKVPARRLSDQQRARMAKLDVLAAAGMQAYPVAVPRTDSLADVDAEREGETVSITGRVVRLRDFGGVVFAVLRENSRELQVMVTRDRPEADPALFRRVVDLADTISVTGDVTRSRTGELSVHATSWCMASKALVPPPDKYRGLVDADQKARLRHVDLALNAEPTRLLVGRSIAVRAMRDVFKEHGFLEVETPILQSIHGGANARPFITHINAYDMNLYLRIAPELFLKRLAVGGFQRVFEIGRNFRNEGVDYKHNPEFTSVEAYQAYADYNVMRHLTREIIVEMARAVHGRPIAISPDGEEIDLDVEWPVVTCHEAVSRAVGEEVTPDTPIERVRELCEKHGVEVGIDHSAGTLVSDLYDELVEGQTTFPTFYTDFPKETSPLTREHRTDPRLAERWDLVGFGSELGTAYSELVNPVDQRDRLTRQSLLAALGDPEAMEVDEEFLTALEFGLPPTGGLGLGVDRCYMFVVGATIRETLTFPFVKPQR